MDRTATPLPRFIPEDTVWLVTNADELLANVDWPTDVLQLMTHFRKKYSPARSHLLCELLELRNRAKRKFSRAQEMFFYRRGFEQATDELIATYKARQFPTAGRTIDLCCGIGGDAIALAQFCSSLSILDREHAATTMATANIRLYTNKEFRVVNHEVQSIDLSEFDFWHIDPDRRPNEKRQSEPDNCEPPLNDFLSTKGLSENGAIKLAPAADASDLLQRGAELEWIGHDRECQQQIAWLGSLARNPGKRTATLLLKNADESPATIIDQGFQPIEIANKAKQFMYEPQACVLAAGLESSIAAQWGLTQLSEQTAYYVSDEKIASPLLTAFEVIDDLAFHRKTLQQELKKRNAFVAEVKKRGVTLDPNALQRELNHAKDGVPIVLLLYKKQLTIRVTLAKRILSSDKDREA